MKKQAGFTLIELVVVIVILGILAATAVPKFVDLSGEAEQAATQAAAAALTSAGNLNYAKRKANSTNGVAIDDTNACTGTILSATASLLAGGASLVASAPSTTSQFVPSEATTGSGKCTAGAGSTAVCTLTSKGGKTATAYVPCTN